MIGTSAQLEREAKLSEAATLFIARRDRTTHPEGRCDHGKWWPSDAEWQECCKSIRTPSVAYPWSLMVHCRTAAHIANLMGVSASEIRRRVAEIEAVERAVARTTTRSNTRVMQQVEELHRVNEDRHYAEATRIAETLHHAS